MKKDREQSLIDHGDMGSILRQAKAELRDHLRSEARKAEVDRRAPDAPLDVPVLLVEDANGVWKAETTTQVFPSQRETLWAKDRSERIVLADLRQVLKDAMTADRYAGAEGARKAAALANIWVVARIPFNRIVSK